MVGARGFTRLLCGRIHAREPSAGDDEAAAALALAQEGVATRHQLMELGISSDAIDHRVAVGRLQLLFRGVYAVGHRALSPNGRALAAVMSCWPDAAASHETTLFLAGVIEAPGGLPHVTATRPRRARPGLIVHRSVLPPEDLTHAHGVPTTTLARAFLDLAPRRETPGVRRRLKDAEFAGSLSVDDLIDVLERHPTRPGRRALAAITTSLVDDRRRTRSPLEDRFLTFCRRRGLPLPETNVALWIGGTRYEPDCLWREARLIVELDGRDAHARELAFASDRARDRALIGAGWVPMRVTSSDLNHDAVALEADIRRALAGARRFDRTGAG